MHLCGTVLDFEGLEVDDMGLAGVSAKGGWEWENTKEMVGCF